MGGWWDSRLEEGVGLSPQLSAEWLLKSEDKCTTYFAMGVGPFRSRDHRSHPCCCLVLVSQSDRLQFVKTIALNSISNFKT